MAGGLQYRFTEFPLEKVGWPKALQYWCSVAECFSLRQLVRGQVWLKRDALQQLLQKGRLAYNHRIIVLWCMAFFSALPKFNMVHQEMMVSKAGISYSRGPHFHMNHPMAFFSVPGRDVAARSSRTAAREGTHTETWQVTC